MSNLAVIAVFILSVCLFHLVSRVIARRRQMRWRSRHDASTAFPTALAVIVAPPTVVAGVQLPVAHSRAFPLVGVVPSRVAAGSLEQLLRHVAGVTAAYVSPATALVYLDYLPAQVTEDELVQAIQHEGYRVGDAAHRFDWRHAPHGLMGPSVP